MRPASVVPLSLLMTVERIGVIRYSLPARARALALREASCRRRCDCAILLHSPFSTSSGLTAKLASITNCLTCPTTESDCGGRARLRPPSNQLHCTQRRMSVTSDDDVVVDGDV